MSYMGNVELKASNIRRFDVTGSTSATHTLTWTAPNEQTLIVTINGVKQQNNYTVSGTTLTLDTALITTDALEVIGINDVGTTITPAQGSVNADQLATDAVSTVKIADDAITSAKIAADAVDSSEIAANAVGNAEMADDAIGIAELSATGTASASTYLRGDNSWVSAGASNIDGLSDCLVENNSIWLGNDPSSTTSSAGENVAVGTTALDAITTGDNNTAVGYQALTALEDGSANVVIGAYAGDAMTSATDCTAVGQSALSTNITSAKNVAVGKNSLEICTGASNTALGEASGAMISSGGHNTAIGRQALGKDSAGVTGGTNTALGSGTGNDVTSGENNTFLGYDAGDANSPSGSVTTGSNQFCLGNNSTSDLFCADTSISSSDERDKADITDFTHGLSFVKQLRPVTYKWDKRSWYVQEDSTPADILSAVPDGTHKKSRVNLGLLAQEVQALEQAIGYGNSKEDRLVTSLTDDGVNMGLKYERLVPILVNAIKELSSRIEQLENQ